jgi:hypothetical protein
MVGTTGLQTRCWKVLSEGVFCGFRMSGILMKTLDPVPAPWRETPLSKTGCQDIRSSFLRTMTQT